MSTKNNIPTVTVETLASACKMALTNTVGGKSLKAVSNNTFEDRLARCVNTVAALATVYCQSDFITINGAQYRVGEYDLPTGFADLVEFSKVYFSSSARFTATPFLTSTLQPVADMGLMTPGEIDALVVFMNGLDGVNVKVRKLDNRIVKTWNDLGVLFIGDSFYLVNSEPVSSDFYRAQFLDLGGNIIPTEHFEVDNSRISPLDANKWLLGMGSGGNNDGSEG